MRTCREYEDMISAFIDGALAEDDRAALMEHMAACPACQEYFDQQIALHDALLADAESIRPPEDFASDVMARVRFTPQDKRKKPAVRWQRWAALAACCAIAALALWRGGAGARQVNVAGAAAGRPAVQTEGAEKSARFAGGAESAADVAAPDSQEPAPKREDAPAAPVPAPVLDSAPPEDPAEYPVEEEAQIAPQAETAETAEGKAVSREQRTVNDGGAQLESAPAADTPAVTSLDGEPALSGGLAAPKAPHTILTASPAAAAWVEETLDLPWTAGGRYELTAGEYAQLREALEAAGEDFTEQPGDADEFLLIAESSPETD